MELLDGLDVFSYIYKNQFTTVTYTAYVCHKEYKNRLKNAINRDKTIGEFHLIIEEAKRRINNVKREARKRVIGNTLLFFSAWSFPISISTDCYLCLLPLSFLLVAIIYGYFSIK